MGADKISRALEEVGVGKKDQAPSVTREYLLCEMKLGTPWILPVFPVPLFLFPHPTKVWNSRM